MAFQEKKMKILNLSQKVDGKLQTLLKNELPELSTFRKFTENSICFGGEVLKNRNWKWNLLWNYKALKCLGRQSLRNIVMDPYEYVNATSFRTKTHVMKNSRYFHAT